MRRAAAAALAFAYLGVSPATAERLVAALSSHRVAITSNYTGGLGVAFGAIERDGQTVARAGNYDVVVTVTGPRQSIVVREKEPLGPMVRHGDDQWFDIVKWVLFAMVDAEEMGVTQGNVDEMAKSDKPDLKRAFGTDGNLGEQLGLTKDWFYRIIKTVGNYGESFDRNVGSGSKLQIARGLNQLWNKGGIQYAPPIR